MTWKLYAVAFSLLLARSWIELPFSHIGVTDVLDIPVTLVGLAGLFAFAFRKRLFVPRFWQVWVFAQVAWDVTYNIIGFSHQLQAMLTVFGVTLPLYAALFLYAYRSRPLWAATA